MIRNAVAALTTIVVVLRSARPWCRRVRETTNGNPIIATWQGPPWLA
jgi:hypothetical protein